MDLTGIHTVGISMYMIFHPHCIYIFHTLSNYSEINLFRYLSFISKIILFKK